MRNGGSLRGQWLAYVASDPQPWLAHAKTSACDHERCDVRRRARINGRSERLDTAGSACLRASTARHRQYCSLNKVIRPASRTSLGKQCKDVPLRGTGSSRSVLCTRATED